jgi:hypothetical protein
MNAILLDSLENEIRIREQFLENIRDIIAGREPTIDMNILPTQT